MVLSCALRLAWVVYDNITSKVWFETFVMANIALIGIASGVDIDMNQTGELSNFVDVASALTTAVFTVEVVLKLISEGYTPVMFFTDVDDGWLVTFAFS